jgi:PhoPQ-activated pathogenicity-related protein
MPRLLALAFLTLAAPASGQEAKSPSIPSELTDYVALPEPDFAWKKVSTAETPQGTVHTLELTSQKWHGILWQHGLQIVVPKGAKPSSTVVLWNQGGRPSASNAVLALLIAERVQAPVAFLYGVPNQPLFGGKKEDALIAETFVKYLETGDGTWPLLFPMVKSVVKAMDVVQAFARDEMKTEVKQFVVTGASKRGWTSWLTAATGDKRVKAIAPLVIDTLKFPTQMGNQVVAFGKPSEMIADYTRRGLVPIPKGGNAEKLWVMIDPWVYRDRLTLPKFIINGANDPYWPLDALNSYWGDLKGPKWVEYIPNAGHDLREGDGNGGKQLVPMRAVNTLSAFCKSQVFDKPLPTLDWTSPPAAGGYLVVKPVGKVEQVSVWTASSETRDFRQARWTETVAFAKQSKKRYDGTLEVGLKLPEPTDAFTAAFGEVVFDFDGVPLHVSTQVRIAAPKK